MDDPQNTLGPNSPNVIFGPPPGYPTEPQFTNLNNNETLRTSLPAKPAKVLIKDTFITIISESPPSTTRNRTESSDTILLGSRISKNITEYVSGSINYRNTNLPIHIESPTITQDNIAHMEDGNNISVPNITLTLSNDSASSPHDLDESDMQCPTTSIPYYQMASRKTLPPHFRFPSPLPTASPKEMNTAPASTINTTIYTNQDENDHNIKNRMATSDRENLTSNYLSQERYRNNIASQSILSSPNISESNTRISPITPDNKFETKPIDPNITEFERDKSLEVDKPDTLARELANTNIPLINLPICNNGYSTVMWRNIPNKYTQSMIMNVIDEHFKYLYDFFYLPIDFRNKCNVGYAFINFIHPYFAELFWQKFDNFKLNAFKSNKVCAVTWGRVQGLKANIDHYRNSAVMSITKGEYKPLLLENGVEIPWPSSDRPIPEVKLRTKKN